MSRRPKLRWQHGSLKLDFERIYSFNQLNMFSGETHEVLKTTLFAKAENLGLPSLEDNL